jgi:hypothetical protein
MIDVDHPLTRTSRDPEQAGFILDDGFEKRNHP